MNAYFEKMLCQFIEGKIDFEIDFSQYPKELYRYRPCNNNNFDSLENDYLWMVHPSSYKDPFDAHISIDREDLADAFEEDIINHIAEFFFFILPPQGMCESKNGITYAEVKTVAENIFFSSSGKYDKNQAIENIKSYFHSLPINQQRMVSVKCEELFNSNNMLMLKESFNNFIEQTASGSRENYMTCCLTKRKDNRNMWENYAEDYTGFVIRYSLDKDNEFAQMIRYLFEVEYFDNIAPLDMRYLLDIHSREMFYGEEPDLVVATLPMLKRILVKNSDYKSEEEWRFIAGKLENNQVPFPFASAVYAGYKISDENLNKLKEICKKKDIPLYKQELDSIGGRFVYYPVDLGED